jgi:hypothetical protein
MQTKDIIDLPLAVQDFMPIALFATGLFFIARMISRKNKMCGILAYFGGLLITLGGSFKAVWKLIQGFGGNDIPVLSNSLFVLLSAGFICVAFALWRSQRRVEAMNLAHVWTTPVALVAVAWAVAGYVGFFTNSRAWFFILLGITTSANVALLLQLIYRALKPAPIYLAVGLFIVNLIVIFTVAGNSNQDVTFQWFKQAMITLGQASFAIGAWLLLKKGS